MAGARSNGIFKKWLHDLEASRPARELGRKVIGLLERWSAEDEPLGGDVASVMTRAVASCSGNDTLHRAAQIMWDRDCGAVPVVDAEGRAVGVVTDRDLCMAAYTRGRPLSAISVSSLLAGKLHTCVPSTSLDEAIARMRFERVRRLVVVDPRDQRLVGMLSLADLARHLSALAPTRSRAAQALSQLLASLSERRAGVQEFPAGPRTPAARAAE
ncbi:MAG TPA: CBS domain-containing protein [Polyangiaceae bacterium]|jgi:CBS domain-containing protein|nr:CBS domain-containing protein [Polyangiaceae bacterium]